MRIELALTVMVEDRAVQIWLRNGPHTLFGTSFDLPKQPQDDPESEQQWEPGDENVAKDAERMGRSLIEGLRKGFAGPSVPGTPHIDRALSLAVGMLRDVLVSQGVPGVDTTFGRVLPL